MDSAQATLQVAKDALTSNSTKSGIEPPSGIQGKGTVDQPYDQGNAPAQASSVGQEPVSGQQGKGTIDEPYDKGNQAEQPLSAATTVQTAQSPSQPVSKNPLDSPSTTHQGSGNPDMEPTKEQVKAIEESRGRDEAAQRTTSTPDPSGKPAAKKPSHFDAAKSGAGEVARTLKYEERDVSPGELRDGSHAVTSGDRGESYAPGTMSKLKDKFGFGRDRK